MESQGKNLLLLCGFSLLLPACAPSLPMLAIGAVAYVAQTQLSKPQAPETPPPKTKAVTQQKKVASPPVKAGAARQQKKVVSPPVAKKSSRGFTEHCRQVNGRIECTRS
jgi:hypothetical protein